MFPILASFSYVVQLQCKHERSVMMIVLKIIKVSRVISQNVPFLALIYDYTTKLDLPTRAHQSRQVSISNVVNNNNYKSVKRCLLLIAYFQRAFID